MRTAMIFTLVVTVGLLAGPAYANTCGNPKSTMQAAEKLNKTVRLYSALVLSGSVLSGGPIYYSFAPVYDLRANAQKLFDLATNQANHSTATACPAPLPANSACDIYRMYYSKLRNNVNYLNTMIRFQILPYNGPHYLYYLTQWHKVVDAYHQLGDVING